VGPLGHRGLALAFAIAAGCESLLLVWLLRGRLRDLTLRPLRGTLGRAAVASAAMGAVVIALRRPAEPLLAGGEVERALGLALVIGAAVVVYIGTSWALGAPELRGVRAAAHRSAQPDAR
jgi:peptidoglycan biosynthesis protein MviN/MurJ (putative lipid II flippase)